jgi:hypothetical protein
MTMTKQVCATALMVCALASPARAELKYTMRIESRPSAVTTTPANPRLTALAENVVQSLAPAGGLELTVTVGERGTRVDYLRRFLAVPAGGSTIVRPDGSMVVIDQTARTYWQMARPALTAGATPAVTVRRTGESSTIAGTQTERVTIEIRVPLPAEAQSGLPAEASLTGEAWLSSRYRQYGRLAHGVAGASAVGLDALAAEGFVMRSILRGDLLGDREVESVVTSLEESAVPASLFEVPAGFTEVAPPSRLPQ